MRVAICSRIFEPETSAASFRLKALATAFLETGATVEVLTVQPPAQSSHMQREGTEQRPGYKISRFPVLRDKTGYVRGYVQYLSFDIPLFFRLLFGKRRDLLVVEPPPTTGVAVRLAAAWRRTPYAYYAADIWSDAAESTGAPGIVVRVVRSMERFTLEGAQSVLSVNEGVTERIREIAPNANVTTVGNGVDTSVFTAKPPASSRESYFLYAGTASEWQGAGIFIDAFGDVLANFPDTKLVFLGSGSDWPVLKRMAEGLPIGAIEFVSTVPPEEAAKRMRGALASVASIRPESGYDFAFPTKVFASWASGTRVVFAGKGPVTEFMDQYSDEAELGYGVPYERTAVADALRAVLVRDRNEEERDTLSRWAVQRVSLRAVAERAVKALE